jgi:hypothetical protein
LNLIYDIAKKMVVVKEWKKLFFHQVILELLMQSPVITFVLLVTGDVLGFIYLLDEHNLFMPNFGAKKVLR